MALGPEGMIACASQWPTGVEVQGAELTEPEERVPLLRDGFLPGELWASTVGDRRIQTGFLDAGERGQ